MAQTKSGILYITMVKCLHLCNITCKHTLDQKITITSIRCEIMVRNLAGTKPVTFMASLPTKRFSNLFQLNRFSAPWQPPHNLKILKIRDHTYICGSFSLTTRQKSYICQMLSLSMLVWRPLLKSRDSRDFRLCMRKSAATYFRPTLLFCRY